MPAASGFETPTVIRGQFPSEARRGDIVAEIIVPAGFASRLRGMAASPTLILRTARGGISGRVERQTEALVFNLNRRLQDSYIQANLDYVELLKSGGTGTFLGNEFEVLGLERAAEILDELLARPQPSEIEAETAELRDFIDEAQLALDQTGASLRATANPIELQTEDEERRERLLSTQLQAYALALTLQRLRHRPLANDGPAGRDCWASERGARVAGPRRSPCQRR